MATLLTDSQLVSRSRVDSAAFGLLFDRHAVAVHRFLARRGGRQLADDLLTEVFATAFVARNRYDSAYEQARPWLYAIALNTIRNELRSRTRETSAINRLPGPTDTDPYDEADDRLVAQARQADVTTALALLPEPERDVVLLVAWEGLSPTEAARVLDVPPGTARSRLHRARALLRNRLNTHDPSAFCAAEES